jgi:hypothetical protein
VPGRASRNDIAGPCGNVAVPAGPGNATPTGARVNRAYDGIAMTATNAPPPQATPTPTTPEMPARPAPIYRVRAILLVVMVVGLVVLAWSDPVRRCPERGIARSRAIVPGAALLCPSAVAALAFFRALRHRQPSILGPITPPRALGGWMLGGGLYWLAYRFAPIMMARRASPRAITAASPPRRVRLRPPLRSAAIQIPGARPGASVERHSWCWRSLTRASDHAAGFICSRRSACCHVGAVAACAAISTGVPIDWARRGRFGCWRTPLSALQVLDVTRTEATNGVR